MDFGVNGRDVGQEAVVILLKRPVNDGGATNDVLFWHEAPYSGIRAVGAIIT